MSGSECRHTNVDTIGRIQQRVRLIFTQPKKAASISRLTDWPTEEPLPSETLRKVICDGYSRKIPHRHSNSRPPDEFSPAPTSAGRSHGTNPARTDLSAIPGTPEIGRAHV